MVRLGRVVARGVIVSLLLFVGGCTTSEEPTTEREQPAASIESAPEAPITVPQDHVLEP